LNSGSNVGAGSVVASLKGARGIVKGTAQCKTKSRGRIEKTPEIEKK